MGDILNISFTTGVPDKEKYQIGFYKKDSTSPEGNASPDGYTFEVIDGTSTIANSAGATHSIVDTLPPIIDNGMKKSESKNLFLTCLLFIIIGNSSIYYYFEKVDPKEFGVFNLAFKVVYHCIGFLFLIKMMQYIWYTCYTSYYIYNLDRINNKVASKYDAKSSSFRDLDTKGHQVRYIVDPFSIKKINIIPVSLYMYNSISTELYNVITDEQIKNAKGKLNQDTLFPDLNKLPKSTPKYTKQYESIKWLTFISSVIIVCIIAMHATLLGIPIYGVLYYYNPFACFNMAGFYTLIKSLWKKGDDVCDAYKTDNSSTKTCGPLEHLKNKTLEQCGTFVRTYNGIEDHLVFDAFKLRSVKVYKNTNILNIFFQFMYIYNCATIFINPLTALILYMGLGYVPATPSYFVSGNATIEAMKKSIKLPFYKKWLFYFTQGRCYKSNIVTGVIRRFMTMGLDVWNMDTIFNNDKMKLVCEYKKYFKVVGILSIMIIILNIVKVTEITSSFNILPLHIVSLVINCIVIIVAYIYIKRNKSGSGEYKIYGGNDLKTEDSDINEYIKNYKNKDVYELFKDIRTGVTANESPDGALYWGELILGITTIIILNNQKLLSKSSKLIMIIILTILLIALVALRNNINMKFLGKSNELSKKIKSQFDKNMTFINNELTNSKSHNNNQNVIRLLKELKNTIPNSVEGKLKSLEQLITDSKTITGSETHNNIITKLDELHAAIKNNHNLNNVKKAIKINKNILSNDHSDRENWDIHTNINHNTNLYTTILLNVVDEWTNNWKLFFKNNKKSNRNNSSDGTELQNIGPNQIQMAVPVPTAVPTAVARTPNGKNQQLVVVQKVLFHLIHQMVI